MDNHTQSAIEFKNVSYSVEDTHILKNITGAFPKGRITTLVGPSGAGKSSLLKLCNGLASPNDGEIFIDGEPISSFEPAKLRRHVGIALQNAPMIKGSVYDNLSLPLRLQNKQLAEEDAISFLKRVGLEAEFLHHDSADLSGGQRQKVSIMRTLINRSKILLLDEITSALDVNSAKEMEELILKINEDLQVTIVWITHDLDQAKKVGDFTWVLIDGELVEAGPAGLLDHPANEQVRRFVTGGKS